MVGESSIITIGLAPAWDITCWGQNLDWGGHQIINDQTILPAGKAFNISRALAWMGQTSIANGLWGDNDYEQMQKVSRVLWPLIDVNMTAVTGDTRRNITIIDTADHKEMHLRNKTELVSKKALQQLRSDLEKTVKENHICVFAGAMPQADFLDDIIEIIKKCHGTGAKIVLDTSGPALKRIIETGLIWMIKPNVFELNELLDVRLEDNISSLTKAGREMLSKVENILISRGKNGAVFINNQGIWQSQCVKKQDFLSTVGCGDYLLAGFLKGYEDSIQIDSALSTAIKVATAKAWDWTEQKSWPEVQKQVQIKLSKSK